MEKVNKVKKNAEAYRNLLNIEYYFCLGYKGKGFEVRIHFYKEEFHHLEGIGTMEKDKMLCMLEPHMEDGAIDLQKEYGTFIARGRA